MRNGPGGGRGKRERAYVFLPWRLGVEGVIGMKDWILETDEGR